MKIYINEKIKHDTVIFAEVWLDATQGGYLTTQLTIASCSHTSFQLI